MNAGASDRLAGLLAAEVPPHWDVRNLGEIVEMTRRPQGLERPPEIPFLPMQLISDSELDIEHWEMRPEHRVRSGTYVEQGDVLLARITPCFENGKLGIVGAVPSGWAFATTEVYAMRSPSLRPRFLAHYLKTPAIRASLVKAMEGATGRMRVPKEALEALPVPVPPVGEQDQIVLWLEGHLRTVGQGTSDLSAATGSSKRYLASCFDAAFAGRLTSAGQTDTAQLEEVAEIQSGIAKGRPGEGDLVELPYIRTANVQAGYLDLTTIKTLRVTPAQRTRHRLQGDDVLVLEGGDADKVGRGWIWEGQIGECLHQNHVFAVRPDTARLIPRYLAYFINAPQARRYFLSAAKQTTNLASINKTNLRALPIPLFSLEEQREIVRVLDSQAQAGARLRGQLARRGDEASVLVSALHLRAFSGGIQLSVAGVA